MNRSALNTLKAIRQASSVRRTVVLGKRGVHQRVPTSFDVEAGLPGFLSPEATKTIAVEWQQGVLDRLNDLVRGTEVEHASVLQTIKQTASDPTMSLAFNYASEALNNSFFLSTLSPRPSTPSPDRAFWTNLSAESSHLKNLPALISHFSSHVAGMHPSSSGYVWLVADQNGNIGVVGTYAGGTVLVQARAQMGPMTSEDRILGEKILQRGAASSPSTPTSDTTSQPTSSEASTGASIATQTAAKKQQPQSDYAGAAGMLNEIIYGGPGGVGRGAKSDIGKQLHPILCLSVHPHCYIKDYGVWGRDEYVKKWWSAIDWNTVETNWEKYRAKVSMSK